MWADDAAFPYGAWEEAALSARILDLFGTLLTKYEPELSVIPCNTASTLVIDDLRRNSPATLRRHGAGHQAGGRAHRSGMVSVLATPGTVQAAIYARPDREMGAECHVRLSGRTAGWAVPKPTCAKLCRRGGRARRDRPLHSWKRTARAPTSWCSAARTIPSW